MHRKGRPTPAFLLFAHPDFIAGTRKAWTLPSTASLPTAMPTVFTHAVLPLAAGVALGTACLPPRLIAAGMLAAVLPDADVVAFKLGIDYAHALGHRGASHSLVFASMCGMIAACGTRWFKAPVLTTFLFIALSAASHPLLDMFTDGGLGVALLWPWSDARHFAPWRMIEVSPFANRFFSARGVEVLLSELRWVWLPALTAAGFLMLLRRRHPAL